MYLAISCIFSYVGCNIAISYILYRGDVDTGSREALIMEDITVASHDQEHSLKSSEFEETELPKSININLTAKEISADENSKEIELHYSEDSLNELKVVTDGGDFRHNSTLSMSDELSHRKLVVEIENAETEDCEKDVIAIDELSVDKNNILQQRRELISRPSFKITQIKRQLYSTYHIIVSLLK